VVPPPGRPGDLRRNTGPVVGRRRRAAVLGGAGRQGRPSGEDGVAGRAVGVLPMGQGAALGPQGAGPGRQGQVLREPEPGGAGADRPELAADLGRGGGLEVKTPVFNSYLTGFPSSTPQPDQARSRGYGTNSAEVRGARGRFDPSVDVIAPSEAWGRRMRCK